MQEVKVTAHSSTYRGARGGGEASEGEAAWERWWSGSGFSCCLFGNCGGNKNTERETQVNTAREWGGARDGGEFNFLRHPSLPACLRPAQIRNERPGGGRQTEMRGRVKGEQGRQAREEKDGRAQLIDVSGT